ncbi:MAG: hypothetical protein HY043_08670 [Verrucomicrobia bacterium]|nr:hypothetical protein [Verrucomicrobiota bacterium]
MTHSFRFGCQLRFHLALLWLGAVLLCGGVPVLNAADAPPDSAGGQDSLNETERMQKEIEKLQETNRQLQQENQQLRKLLGELIDPFNSGRVVTPTAPAITNLAKVIKPSEVKTNDAKPRVAASVPQAFTHWQSFSGKRHNATCRYFKYPGGNPCGPTDGVACRLCGG